MSSHDCVVKAVVFRPGNVGFIVAEVYSLVFLHNS